MDKYVTLDWFWNDHKALLLAMCLLAYAASTFIIANALSELDPFCVMALSVLTVPPVMLALMTPIISTGLAVIVFASLKVIALARE